MEDIKENISQPLNVDTTVNSNSRNRLFIIGGIVSFIAILLVLISYIQSQQSLSYKSNAKEKNTSTHIVIEVSPEVSPSPAAQITDADGLDQALKELENTDINASNTIQSHINQIGTDSTQ